MPASLLELLVKSVELETLANKMEERGGELASRVVKKFKRSMERERKQGKRKFQRIKRLKSGGKKFAVQGGGPKADLIDKSFEADFNDVFKGS
jgi:hypothetical protein